jgi:hypothetical protein
MKLYWRIGSQTIKKWLIIGTPNPKIKNWNNQDDLFIMDKERSSHKWTGM